MSLPDLRALAVRLADDPLARRCAPEHLAGLAAALARAHVAPGGSGPASGASGPAGERPLITDGQRIGTLRPHGSLVLCLPGSAPPRRLLDVDRRGTVTLAVHRGAGGRFQGAWARTPEGGLVGVVPGGAAHPLWGASDRIVGGPDGTRSLTLTGAIDWDRLDSIPPLADPTRLPPGAGTAILNLLAGLAADQGGPVLRYRGPFATEQLFWALAESFRWDPASPDPLAVFLADAEDTFLAGAAREAPLDWTPAPHERLFLAGGLYVQLRDGVEKVVWEGRPYYRPDWQGLLRSEHRVVRPVAAPAGGPRYVVGLVALGQPLEDHLVLDADGEPLDTPAPAGPPADAETPLAPLWHEALASLLPLDATPLLAPAIARTWPELDVAWGPVARDLVAVRGERLRLSPALARLYQAERAGRAGPARRALARGLVREMLRLLGPPVRRAAAAWLESRPPDQQAAWLEAGGPAARQAAAARAARALERLLDALVAGDALPLPAP